MPQYKFVVERFKTYHSWKSQKIGSDESIFSPRWSTLRWFYRLSFLGTSLLLIACTILAIRGIPSDKAVKLSLEQFGSLVQQFRENDYALTGTACPNGIIGELENGRTYWVELGYSGTRWTYAYNLPDSALADVCVPPLRLQYQRLAIMALVGLLFAGLYILANYMLARHLWNHIYPVTLKQQGETIILLQNGIERAVPESYEELDKLYNVSTDSISLQRVFKSALFLVALASICAWIAASA